jgi:hypothetical protein
MISFAGRAVLHWKRRRGHQQIGFRLLPTICFIPQLLAIIGTYLLLLLLFVSKKFCYYLLLLYQGSLIIAIVRILFLQLL